MTQKKENPTEGERVFPPLTQESLVQESLKESESSENEDGLSKTEGSRSWVTETHGESLSISYLVEKNLFFKKSPFQSVRVVESAGYGKMLLNDDIVMISERDERIYHEMMVHVPFFTHPAPERVLIIGGGDGGTAREVLLHPEVKECDMVEIDSSVVEACQKFIPQTSQSLNHPKLKLHIEDGIEYVKDCQKKYDVVLIDSTDPIGPALPLFNESFYKNVRLLLQEKAIVVSQAESPFYTSSLQKKLLKILKNVGFSFVGLYNYSNMTYPGGLWSFSFASQGNLHPTRDYNETKWKAWKHSFFYYNRGVHRASFLLPEFMQKEYKSLL